MKHKAIGLVLGAMLAAGGVPALAQTAANYPNRAVTIVVPSAAGGGLDATARIIAEGLRRHFGQPFIIENKPGAATALGSQFVYRAAPDGYTILASPNSPLVFLPLTKKDLAYDASKFVPVAITGIQAMVLAVKPAFAGKSFADFVASAKANPGKMNYGSPGAGSGNHLASLLFQKAAGFSAVHVPFNAHSLGVQAMLRGDIDFYLIPVDVVLEHHAAGNMKIFAVGTPQRSRDLPDVPTFRELGLPPEVVLTIIYAMVAPPGTPPDIAAKLNEGINAAFKMPDIRQRYEALKIDPTGGSPADLEKLIDSEMKLWAPVVKENGLAGQ